MQVLIDLTAPTVLEIDDVGGKAFNLHRLHHIGVPVPAALVVPASVHNNRHSIKLDDLCDQILNHEIIATGDVFAVRSSGVGEDGENNSFAGIFESYLDVPRDKIHEAVLQVWDSIESARSAMYANERAVSINSMGVVIQHMIPADYAGVAFSSSPMEDDDRIALIEIVSGNGDALVSGKKTPATLRVNKLTGMVRIAQNGKDDIPDELLQGMAQQLLPMIEKIESAYGIAVDIEWAIAGGKVHILQARPITA